MSGTLKSLRSTPFRSPTYLCWPVQVMKTTKTHSAGGQSPDPLTDHCLNNLMLPQRSLVYLTLRSRVQFYAARVKIYRCSLLLSIFS